MAATKELKGVAHNLAHHSQSALSWLHPHLAQACVRANMDGVTFDLLATNLYPQELPESGPLALALGALREWFFSQLKLLGHDRAVVTRAILAFTFRAGDDYDCAVEATIGTNTGREYSGSVAFITEAPSNTPPHLAALARRV